MSSIVRLRQRCAVLVAATLALGSGLHAADVSVPLSDAVVAWLATLDLEQSREAKYRFDDTERYDLRLAPIGLEGLRRDAMNAEQWEAWLAVLDTALSETGMQKVRTIMSLEREVRERDAEGWSGPVGGFLGGFIHGEDRYFASVYRTPLGGLPGPQGVRFDGHHLSLNWTESPEGALSVTPLFLGAEPREVEAGRERAGLRALAAEEDRAFALWSALKVGQRITSELPFSFASGLGGGNRALFLGEGARIEPGAPQGVAYRDLEPAQRALLDALVETYLANFDAAIAAQRRAAIDAAGRDGIHFAWAGFLEPGHAGYWRVQGPTFLIEFDNTMEAADHVHSVYREFEGDFGRDVLADHYAREHGRAFATARRAPGDQY